MDASILQPLALRPAACPERGHCRAIAEQEAQTQERLTRAYARRVGLEDCDDDHRI